MRILVAHPGPNFSVADVYAGWVEALRGLGCHVDVFRLDERLNFYSHALLPDPASPARVRPAVDRAGAVQLATGGLYGALYQTWPDVLLVVSALFLPTRVLDVARARGTRVVVLHTESPYEDDRQANVAEHADINLVNDPTNIDRFPAGTVYTPHAYRPDIHQPGAADSALACDLGFVGTGFPSRIQFLEQMDLAGLDVLLAGNWQALGDTSPLRPHVAHGLDECVDNSAVAAVYRSARAGINLYRREANRPELSAGWAVGPREVEMAACGLFFLRDPRGESDELFPSLPAFTSPAQASELLRWWLAHPEQRADAAATARLSIQDRTFANQAAALLRRLDR